MKTNGKIQLYPMLRVVLFLIFGIIIGEALCGVVRPVAWLTMLVCCIVGFLVTWRWAVFQSLFMLAAWFFTGALFTSYELVKINEPLVENEIEYEAVVISRPQIAGKVARIDLLTTNTLLPMKIKATLYRDGRAEKLKEGDGIEAVSALEKPANFEESTFDYRRYLLYHGYAATTFLYIDDWQKKKVGLERLAAIDRLKIIALRFRSRLLDEYLKLGFDGQDYAVMAAMTLGDKSGLGKELKDDYSVSGAAHVLALSGLHLSIIYAILSLLFGYRRWRTVGMVMTILAIWAYVFMVGMSVSVMRSAIMLTVYSFISLLNRDRLSLNSLAVAAVIILLCNPLSFYDVGFQMSFMSVLSIIIFYRPILNFMHERVRCLPVVSWLWQLMAVSVAAQIGVAPLVAFYFGRFSCYFLLANVIVIPAATVILYGAVFAIPFSFSQTLLHLFAGILANVVSFLNFSVRMVASLPGASIENISLSVFQLVLVYILIALAAVAIYYMKQMLRPMP